MAERDEDKIKQEVSSELPLVESPPLSPAGASSEAPVEAEASDQTERPVEAEASVDTEVAAEDEAAASAAVTPRPWFQLSRRSQHRVTLAIWVALVAGLGALFGGAISNSLPGHRDVAVAGLQQRKAMQQSIDHLAKQVSDLKAKLAVAAAETHSQIAKISARADREASADITGSIPASGATPVPIPRPAPRIAAPVSRTAVVRSWHILRARGGLIDVEGRDGVYEVVPGAVLPGLGPVQSVERRGGRWVVVTPKGLIVSARDRGYFEDF